MSKLTYDDFKERFTIATALMEAEAPVTEDDVKKAFATLSVYSSWMEAEHEKIWRKRERQLRIERVAMKAVDPATLAGLDLWNELKELQDEERGPKIEERKIPAVDNNNI